jgi:hypothetical protein
MVNVLAGLCYGCGIVLGIIGFAPLMIGSLFANPVIIARNWDNPCDDAAPMSLCTWLTVSSVVSLVLGAIGIVLVICAIFLSRRIAALLLRTCLSSGDLKRTTARVETAFNVLLIGQGIVFFSFLIAWASYGGWLIFDNGPASICFGNELWKMSAANFGAQIAAIGLGWMLFVAVITTK